MNPVLLEAIVKPSVLLVVAAAIMLPLRRASAAMRHMVWTMAVVGLLLLPIGARALPNWNLALPISAGEGQGGAPVMEPEERAAGLQMGPVVGAEDSRAILLSPTEFAGGYLTDRPIPWAVFFVALYGVGVSILFVRLVAERWTLHRMTRGKVAIHDQDWNRLLLECAQCMNLQRPVRLLRGLDHTMPMVFGIWRPTVLIPSVADTWSNDRRRAVLLHELAHVGRHDCLRQLMATLACTVYWVNPGVWWLAQRMRVEGERACDDRVVAAGMTPHDYAGHLIELAYAFRSHRAPGIAVSMARPREIEARLVAVLDSARNRSTPATRSRVASIVIMGALVLPIAVAGSPVTPTDATFLPALAGSSSAQTPVGTAAPGQTPPTQPTPATSTRTAVVRGRVLAEGAGQPLRRAQVRLSGPGISPALSTGTDDDGRYEFTALPAGRFKLTAAKTGYLSIGSPAVADPGRQIEVSQGERVDGINLLLRRGSSLSVYVVDDLGEPADGVRVVIERMRLVGGQRLMRSSGIDVSIDDTDDRGIARLSGIPPGEYYVHANPVIPGRPKVIHASDSGRMLAPTYYPDSITSSDAQRVTIATGQDQNATIRLQVVPAIRVSGSVRSSKGAPVTGRLSFIRMLAGTLSGAIVPLQTDGTFSVALLPGEYIANASTAADVVPRESVNLSVTFGHGDTTGLAITTSPGATLRGRVLFDGGNPPATLRPGALSLAPVAAGMGSIASGQLTWDSDWSFVLQGVRGRGHLRLVGTPPAGQVAGSVEGWFIKSVRLENKDLTDVILDFDSAAEFSNIEVVLTQKPSLIQGAVTTASNAPATESTVVLFPQDRARWTPRSRLIAAHAVDQHGRFRLAGFPAGRYFLAAVSAYEAFDEQNAEWLGSLESRATRVTLTESGSQTVALKVLP